ncbi:MAG: hypothetical protein WCK89_20960 [bacterium]
MSTYTYEQLEQALGPTYKLDPVGEDKKQARVLTADGYDIVFINFEDARIEASLDAKWHKAEISVPEGFPDAAAVAAARQEIAEELQPDWEIAGFSVEDDGYVKNYRYTKEPDINIPMYCVDVRKDVPTLEDAVETIRWARFAETETWV